jgi:hypothetical protein
MGKFLCHEMFPAREKHKQKTMYSLFNTYVSVCPEMRYCTQIWFPFQKLAVFHKVKEIKKLRGGVQFVHRTSDSAN